MKNYNFRLLQRLAFALTLLIGVSHYGQAQTYSGYFTTLSSSESKPTLTTLGTSGLSWTPNSNADHQIPSTSGAKWYGYFDDASGTSADAHNNHLLYINYEKTSLGGTRGGYDYTLNFQSSCYLAFKIPDGYDAAVTVYHYGGNGRTLALEKSDSKPSTLDDLTYTTDGTDSATWKFSLSEGGTYWITAPGSSVYIAGLTVTLTAPVNVTAPDLVTIPNSNSSTYMWYATGDRTLDNNYIKDRNDNKTTYYSGTETSLTRGTETVKVNGENMNGFSLAEDEALGFKLRLNDSGSAKYRLKIFSKSGSTTLLKAGDDVDTATDVAGGYVQQINNTLGEDTGTRLLTYDFTITTEGTYWIKAPEGGLQLGALEVLMDVTSDVHPGVQPFQLQDTGWHLDDGESPMNNFVAFSDGDSSVGKSGAVSRRVKNYVAHMGPSMPFNTTTELNTSYRTVMMNDKNAFAMKLAPGMKITVPVITDAGAYGVIKKGNNLSSATQVAQATGVSSMSYTNTTDRIENIWITGKSEYYVYIAGFSLTQEKGLDEISGFNPIAADYLWYYNGGGGLSMAGFNDTQYRNIANAIGRNDATIVINGSIMQGTNGGQSADQTGTYKLAQKDAIGFKLKANTKYRIRIFTNGQPTNPLKTGPKLVSVTDVPYTTKVSLGSNTYLYIYDFIVGGSDAIYWIYDNAEMLLGGFEVFPYNTTVPSSITELSVSNWEVSATGYTTAKDSESNTGHPYDVLTAGSHTDVYVYGPSLPIDANLVDGTRSVMINKDNAIGIYVTSGTKVTIPYDNSLGGTLKVVSGTPTGTAITLTEATPASRATSGAKEFTAASDGIVWITAADSNPVYISGVDAELTGTAIPDENAISADYLWYAYGNLTQGFTDVTPDKHTMYMGSDLTANDATTVNINGNQYPTYAFTTPDTGYPALGFKIDKGKKGVIRMFYKNLVYLYNDEYYEHLGEFLPLNPFEDTPGTNIAYYYFDTTDEAKTYWIKSNGGFGGFEVLFDTSNPYIQALAASGNGGRSQWGIGSFKTKDENSLINHLNNTPDPSGNTVGTPRYNAVLNGWVWGPTRPITVINSGSTIPISNHNAIAVKLPAGVSGIVVNYYAPEGVSLKVVKGTDGNTPTGTQVGELIAGEGTVSTYRSTMKTVTIPVSGYTSSDIFWVVGNTDKYAYIYSIGLAEELLPIESNHIYRADKTLNSGTVYRDDYYMMYEGDGATLSADGATMMIVGQNNKYWTWEDGNDWMTFKVADGKTGHIKVYYTGGNASTMALPFTSASGFGSYENAEFNPDTNVLQFTATTNYGGRYGWWFGTGAGQPQDYTGYSDFVISLTTATLTSYNIVMQDKDGKRASCLNPAGTKTLLFDLRDFEGDQDIDFHNISQIYIQIGTVKESGDVISDERQRITLESARFVNVPMELRQGSKTAELLYNYETYEEQGTVVFDYTFDHTSASTPQQYYVTGTYNLGAIEVTFDNTSHARVVEWYVNTDTKLIVGSQNPNWVGTDASGASLGAYPAGYDEYATFYVSSGRSANVSFVMPAAIEDINSWEKAVETYDAAHPDEKVIANNLAISESESKYSSIKNSYGKHSIRVDDVSADPGYWMDTNKETWTFNRDKQKADGTNIGTSGSSAKDLYTWYGGEVTYPNERNLYHNGEFGYTGSSSWTPGSDHVQAIKVTATQVKKGKSYSGSDDNANIAEVDGLKGQWKIYMRFVYYAAPTIAKQSDLTPGEKVKITKPASETGSIYYTTDSAEPLNGVSETTKQVPTDGLVDVKTNCMVKAARYVQTPYQFYDECADGVGLGTPTDVLKVISKSYFVFFKVDNAFAVMNKNLDDTDYFNNKTGATVVTVPLNPEVSGTQTEVNNDQGYVYPANPYAYITLGSGRTRYYRNIEQDPATWNFNHGGVNWQADQDGGYRTFLDSYRYKFKCVAIEKGKEIIEESDLDPEKSSADDIKADLEAKNPKATENAYTECNGGIGSPDSENGGLFLQPVAGSFFRVEPEYDGIMTLWIRQNGACDHNNQEDGKITRRPVYIVDENGRIMRGSTVVPTDEHPHGINGVHAMCSAQGEFRSTFEYTWLYGVAKSVYPNFINFPDRWGELADADDADKGFKYFYDSKYKVNDYRAAYIMYGKWFKSININAKAGKLNWAEHVSRYGKTGNQPLYRNDFVADLEKGLDLDIKFAKYGYEMPNFAYVRYRFPVKAGKTYYLGGRGTRVDLVAAQFDPLELNYNGTETTTGTGTTTETDKVKKYRYSDNPTIKGFEETTNGVEINIDWTGAGNSTATYSIDGALSTYSSMVPYALDASLSTNVSTLNGIKVNRIDTNNQNVKDDIRNNVAGTTVNVTLNRKFTAGYWHPIVLPFSLSETRVEEIFGEGTVVLYLDPYKHTFNNEYADGVNYRSAMKPALSGSQLTFTYHKYQMLYANVPAFICPTFEWTKTYKDAAYTNKPETDTDEDGLTCVNSITFKRVTIDKSNLDSKKGYSAVGYQISDDYALVGCYDNTSVVNKDVYYIQNDVDDQGNVTAKLVYVPEAKNRNGVWIKGTSCYITPVSGKYPAPIRTLGYNDFSQEQIDLGYGVSGIEDIVVDEMPIEMYEGDLNVYDMLGRKVGYGSTDGLPKGVYIFNGRKVYVR